MQLNASLSITDALKTAQNEKVRVGVHLRGGPTLSGKVGSVGDNHVALVELTGKEFFDALIRLDDIAALEVRVR